MNKRRMNDQRMGNTNLLVMSPEDMRRRIGAVLDQARQIDSTAHVDVHFASAQDRCRRFCA